MFCFEDFVSHVESHLKCDGDCDATPPMNLNAISNVTEQSCGSEIPSNPSCVCAEQLRKCFLPFSSPSVLSDPTAVEAALADIHQQHCLPSLLPFYCAGCLFSYPPLSGKSDASAMTADWKNRIASPLERLFVFPPAEVVLQKDSSVRDSVEGEGCASPLTSFTENGKDGVQWGERYTQVSSQAMEKLQHLAKEVTSTIPPQATLHSVLAKGSEERNPDLRELPKGSNMLLMKNTLPEGSTDCIGEETVFVQRMTIAAWRWVACLPLSSPTSLSPSSSSSALVKSGDEDGIFKEKWKKSWESTTRQLLRRVPLHWEEATAAGGTTASDHRQSTRSTPPLPHAEETPVSLRHLFSSPFSFFLHSSWLFLLLFSSDFSVQQWARSVLIDMIHSGPPSLASVCVTRLSSPAEIAARHLCWLCQLGVQLLTVLRNAIFFISLPRVYAGHSVHPPTLLACGMTHVWTVLTVLEQRASVLSQKMSESPTATTARTLLTSSSPSGNGTLPSTPFSAFSLLASRLLLLWLYQLVLEETHRMRPPSGEEMGDVQASSRSLSPSLLLHCERKEEEMLTFVLPRINALLDIDPVLPPSVCIAVKKTILKGLIHLLCDVTRRFPLPSSSVGSPPMGATTTHHNDDPEGPYRLRYVGYLWRVMALLSPPPSPTDRTPVSSPSNVHSFPVSCGSLEWILVPLWRYAKSFFHFPQAVEAAKKCFLAETSTAKKEKEATPHRTCVAASFSSTAIPSTAEEREGVLLRALYPLFLLVATLVGTVPAMTQSSVLYEAILFQTSRPAGAAVGIPPEASRRMTGARLFSADVEYPSSEDEWPLGDLFEVLRSLLLVYRHPLGSDFFTLLVQVAIDGDVAVQRMRQARGESPFVSFLVYHEVLQCHRLGHNEEDGRRTAWKRACGPQRHGGDTPVASPALAFPPSSFFLTRIFPSLRSSASSAAVVSLDPLLPSPTASMPASLRPAWVHRNVWKHFPFLLRKACSESFPVSLFVSLLHSVRLWVEPPSLCLCLLCDASYWSYPLSLPPHDLSGPPDATHRPLSPSSLPPLFEGSTASLASSPSPFLVLLEKCLVEVADVLENDAQVFVSHRLSSFSFSSSKEEEEKEKKEGPSVAFFGPLLRLSAALYFFAGQEHPTVVSRAAEKECATGGGGGAHHAAGEPSITHSTAVANAGSAIHLSPAPRFGKALLFFLLESTPSNPFAASSSRPSLQQLLSPWGLTPDTLQCHAACWCWYDVLLRQPDIRQGGGLPFCGHAVIRGGSADWREDRDVCVGLFPLDQKAIHMLARRQGKKWLLLLPYVLKNLHDRIDMQKSDEKDEEGEGTWRHAASTAATPLSFPAFSEDADGTWAGPLCTVYHSTWLCWWTVALMASHTPFSPLERQRFVTCVADLPPLPPASSWNEKRRFASGLSPMRSGTPSTSLASAALSVEAFAFYTLCRHLYVSLLVEHSRYSPTALVTALLHVAGHLSEAGVKVDAALELVHKKWLVALLRYVLPPHIPTIAPSSGVHSAMATSGWHRCDGGPLRGPTSSPELELLRRFAPSWLQEALTTAEKSLEVEHRIQGQQLADLSKREQQEEAEEEEKMYGAPPKKTSVEERAFAFPRHTLADGHKGGGFPMKDVVDAHENVSPPVPFPAGALLSGTTLAQSNDFTSLPPWTSACAPVPMECTSAHEPLDALREERKVVEEEEEKEWGTCRTDRALLMEPFLSPPEPHPHHGSIYPTLKSPPEDEVLCIDSSSSESDDRSRSRSTSSSSCVEIQPPDETVIPREGDESTVPPPSLGEGFAKVGRSRSRSSSTDSLLHALKERKRRKVEVEKISRLSNEGGGGGASSLVTIPLPPLTAATHTAALATGMVSLPSSALLSRTTVPLHASVPPSSSSSVASSTAMRNDHPSSVGALLRPGDAFGGRLPWGSTTGSHTTSVRHLASTTPSSASHAAPALPSAPPSSGIRHTSVAGSTSPALLPSQDYGSLLRYVAVTTPLLSLSSASSSSSAHSSALLYREVLRHIPGCDAGELPTIPLEFHRSSSSSSTPDASHGASSSSSSSSFAHHGSRSLYWSTFIPHIFVDLRFTVHRAVIAILEEGRLRAQRQRSMEWHRSKGSRNAAAGGRLGGEGKRWDGPLSMVETTHPASVPAMGTAVSSTGGGDASFDASYANSVFSSIIHDAFKCRSMARHAANPLDPSALRFSVEFANEVSFSTRQAAVLSCSSSVLSSFGLGEGDVVMVLLPLESVQHAMALRAENAKKEARGGGGGGGGSGGAAPPPPLASLPALWRELGGFPQICVVDVSSERRSLVLRTYVTPAENPNPIAAPFRGCQTGTHGSSPAERLPFLERESSTTAAISFLHALHLAFTGKCATLYVFPLIPIRSYVFAIQSLHSLMAPASPSNFPPLLLLPHTISPIAVRLQQALEQYLDAPGVLPYLKPLLCERGALNEWQLKAVASCLYFVQPNWDTLRLQQQSIHGGVSSAPPMHYRPPAEHEKLPILIIEGPPGTGKTQTIGMLLENLLRHLPSDRRILVCAASNAAVDEVLLRLLSFSSPFTPSSTAVVLPTSSSSSPSVGHSKRSDGRSSGRLVRVGMRDKIHSDVLTNPHHILYIEDLIQLERADRTSPSTRSAAASGVLKGGSTRNGTMPHDHVKSTVLRRARVIFSTLGSLHQLEGLRFHVVIVDEASQATEPDVVQALSLSTGRCVMVGDSKQLQPTVLCLESAKKGMERSLLYRLLESGFPSTLLRIQYRMHPDICRFPNEYVYRGILSTDASVLERIKKKDSLAAKLGATPRFVFINVPQGTMAVAQGTSRCNDAEARQLVRFMRTCREGLGLSVKEFGKECGIITFYQAQCAVIRRELFREEREVLTVATVDSYQGKEMSIILISCVRAPSKQQKNKKKGVPSLGFLTDVGRVNVALTRARELCVVFGHQETFLPSSSECNQSSVKRGDALGEMDGKEKKSESGVQKTENIDTMPTIQTSSTMRATNGGTSSPTASPSLREEDMLRQMLLSIVNR